MKAGKLDRIIVLHASRPCRNEFGETMSKLVEIARLYAEVRQASGVERFVAQQAVAEVTTLFTVRWRHDISPICVIEFEGRFYDVLAVMEVGRREGLVINAKARAE